MIVQFPGLHEHFVVAGDKASARAASRDLPVPGNERESI
jgi:hypothetical protein